MNITSSAYAGGNESYQKLSKAMSGKECAECWAGNSNFTLHWHYPETFWSSPPKKREGYVSLIFPIIKKAQLDHISRQCAQIYQNQLTRFSVHAQARDREDTGKTQRQISVSIQPSLHPFGYPELFYPETFLSGQNFQERNTYYGKCPRFSGNLFSGSGTQFSGQNLWFPIWIPLFIRKSENKTFPFSGFSLANYSVNIWKWLYSHFSKTE